ncbi:MAG TPA: tetratricopeptide repeat protein [Kofleriaceae bacterium]|nr:tetratricopeptide repeat protein [Kofleriaceae bacterium]
MATLGSAQALAQPAGDWGVKRDPFDLTVVARYRAILAKNPYDVGALDQLHQMYSRYRTAYELEKSYSSSTDWATAVVYARIAKDDIDRWKKVVELKADDARGLNALADAERGQGATNEAFGHYQKAAQLASDNATKKNALEWTARLAEDFQNITRLEWAYAQLIALEPKEPKHWTNRALSMQKLNRYTDAIESFAKAEALTTTDPQGKLDLILLRARALVQIGDTHAALEQYNRVLQSAPRGYYLADEAITALIDLHLAAGTLPEFRLALEKRWPPGMRAYPEWKTLANVYEQLGDTEGAIFALKKAVTAAPSERDTHTKLVELYDGNGETDLALAQLEAATKALPADQDFHVQLANRYHDAKETKKAFATLQRLSQTIRTDARVHEDLADLYTKWKRPGLALHELEEIARIEPEPENIAKLGEAYWQGGSEDKALATWKKLGSDPEGLARLAQVYVDHEFWPDAIVVYTQALKLAPKNAELWRARADVHETLEHWEDAFADATKAATLVKGRTLDEGHQVRYQLVRLLSRWAEHETDGENTHEAAAVRAWTRDFVAEPPDLEAGYMLAEYEGRSPSADSLAALERLHKLVPTDLGVEQTLARTYKILHRYNEAIAQLESLTLADPNKALDYQDQIADLKKRIDLDGREGWRDDGIADPDAWVRAHRKPDPIEPFRLGLHMGVGNAMRGPAPHSVLVGMYTSIRIGRRVAFVGRFDWSERGGDMTSVKSAALATGVALPVLNLSRMVVTLGAAHRTELRIGDHMGWDRLGLAGDFTLELIPKKMPGSLAIRFEQGLSDHGQSTALLVELGVGN